MTVTQLETHAKLGERRRWRDPTDCQGRMVVVDELGGIQVVVCDQCGFEAAGPAGQADVSQVLDRRRASSGIPSELQGLSLPDAGLGVSGAVRDWAAGGLNGLVLTGPVGVGKTYLAAAAAWERMTVAPLRWFSVPLLFNRLSLAFGDDDRHDALDILARQMGLALDDVDKTRPTEYAAEQLFCAIESRITAGAALLITTNLALSEIAERYPEPYGEAIVSRLVGYCETFAVEAADRRLARFAA